MLELHPLLATRWSPRSFSTDARVAEAELAALLEAARWAPSSDNSQPWRFLIGRRGSEAYKRVFVNLSPENQRWAGTASVLLVGAHLADPELRHAAYDLGQAMAHLGFQAAALGLYLHQTGSRPGWSPRSAGSATPTGCRRICGYARPRCAAAGRSPIFCCNPAVVA
jgi:nitroreductase